MVSDFHRPTRFPPAMFDSYLGAEDPAHLSRVAHDTAAALLARVREDPDPEVIARLVAYTDEHGIDAIAELWSHASAKSLPGALWRVYLLRALIRQDPRGQALAFQRGTEVSHTIDQVVAGAAIPAGPGEVVELADRILHGLFTGDFAVALDRAAAFARVSRRVREPGRRRRCRRHDASRSLDRAHHPRAAPHPARRRVRLVRATLASRRARLIDRPDRRPFDSLGNAEGVDLVYTCRGRPQ